MAVTTTYGLTTVRNEFTANGYTNFIEAESEVVGLSNGGYAVVYSATSGTFDVPLISFFDADDNPIGDIGGDYSIPYTGATNSVNLVGSPEITELSNGNVAVIWESDGETDVVGAIFNPNTGSVVHSQFVINGFPTDGDPEAIALTGGNWVVAMTSGNQIYMQMMNNSGNPVGGQFSTGVGTDTDPVITALNDGGFVVTYTTVDGADTHIYGTIYNADRSVRTTDFGISDAFGAGGGANNVNTESAVAALNNGNWAVVYTDSGWSGDGLTLQIYNSTGGTVSGFVRVDTNTTTIESDPDITVLENGFIVVSWSSPSPSNAILGRVFTEGGVPVAVNGTTAPFIINNAGLSETDASISAMFEGQFVNTWTDQSSGNVSGEVNEIFSTIVSDIAGDVLQGTALRENMFGNGGSDDFFAGNGDDFMSGGGGNDEMFGGGGDDEMYGDAGLDIMRGGIGDDYMEGGVGIDDVNGGTGNDEMYGNDGNDVMNGAAGNDVMFGGNQNDRMGGQAGTDTMYGQSGNDFMTGGNDNDTLFGGIGNDRLYGQSGNDTMYGEAGIDYINGDTGNDTGYGGTGDDRLFGGANNDSLFGQGDDDLLIGGTGNDFLDGGTGDDRLRGDDGFDTFRFLSGMGEDRLLDFENDIDTIQLDDAIWGGGLTVAQVLATYGTQVQPNRYDLDFGGGDSLIITGRFGAGVTGVDLSDDITII